MVQRWRGTEEVATVEGGYQGNARSYLYVCVGRQSSSSSSYECAAGATVSSKILPPLSYTILYAAVVGVWSVMAVVPTLARGAIDYRVSRPSIPLCSGQGAERARAPTCGMICMYACTRVAARLHCCVKSNCDNAVPSWRWLSFRGFLSRLRHRENNLINEKHNILIRYSKITGMRATIVYNRKMRIK